MVLDDLLEKLPERLELADIRARVDEFTPYVMVALQVSLRTWHPNFHDGSSHTAFVPMGPMLDL